MRLILGASIGVLLVLPACTDERDDMPADGGSIGGNETDSGTDTDWTDATEDPKPGDGGGDGGSTCDAPSSGTYGDCVNTGQAACDDATSSCLGNRLQDPDFGVCTRGCMDVCECWDAPADGTAVPSCTLVPAGNQKVCVLDCSDEKTCPAGMRCSRVTAATAFCVFDNEAGSDTGDTSTETVDCH